MPKRVIDGDAMHLSDRLAAVQPGWVRYHFPWLVPLTLANGVFECDPQRVWAKAYARMGDLSKEDVSLILSAFEKVGLLFRWKQPDGKWWGYWVGIDKKGRLPVPSRRGKKAGEALGPIPPFDKLCEYKRLSSVRTDLCAGLGFGFGSGSGSGLGSWEEAAKNTASSLSEQKRSDEEKEKEIEPVLELKPDVEPKAKKEPASANAVELTNLLCVEIRNNNPNAKITESQVAKWSRDADLMMRRDNRPYEQIWQLISWCQADPFWKTNILSMGTLREKFDQLLLKKNSIGGNGNGTHRKRPGSETVQDHLEQIRRNHEVAEKFRH